MRPLQKAGFDGDPALRVFQHDVQVVDELPVGRVADLGQVNVVRDDLHPLESLLDPRVGQRVPTELVLDVLSMTSRFAEPTLSSR